jgi:hypothetical protein
LFVQIRMPNGLSTSCNIITQQMAEILSPPVGGAYKWCRETGFIYSEGLHFIGSYKHTSTHCQWNASVFQYATQLYHQWCRCKKSAVTKNTRQWKMQVDEVCRQHKITVMFQTKG